MKLKLIKLSAIFTSLTILFSCTLSRAVFTENQNKIYDSVIRLHVLANSDSQYDQNLKLEVRDKIVELTSVLFDDCKSIDEAKEIATKNKALLQRAAKQVLEANGCEYDVSIQTDTELYPVRYYGDFVFPAGEYFSVRVCIGKAKGKNWWCVLFPPMCSSAYVKSTKEDIKLLQDYGFDEALTSSILKKPQKTIIKFKLFD